MHEYNTSRDAAEQSMRDTMTQLADEMQAQEYVIWEKHIEDSEVVEHIHTFGGILCTRRTPVSRYTV